MEQSQLQTLYNDSKYIPDSTPNLRWTKFFQVVKDLK